MLRRNGLVNWNETSGQTRLGLWLWITWALMSLMTMTGLAMCQTLLPNLTPRALILRLRARTCRHPRPHLTMPPSVVARGKARVRTSVVTIPLLKGVRNPKKKSLWRTPVHWISWAKQICCVKVSIEKSQYGLCLCILNSKIHPGPAQGMHIQHGEEIENAETMLEQILRTASTLSKTGTQLEKMNTDVAKEYLGDLSYLSYQQEWSVCSNILHGQIHASKGQANYRCPSESFDGAPWWDCGLQSYFWCRWKASLWDTSSLNLVYR